MNLLKFSKSVQLPAILLLVSAAFLCALTLKNLQISDTVSVQPVERCLIIDPGHGGIDGGAIALNGTKESDINLSLALKLYELAAFCGQPAVMTRSDDGNRTDFATYSEHADLVYRTELINSIPNGVLVSIHQNCYPTSQPSGAQVLYAHNEESRRFGEMTHQSIITCLQKENRRVAEPAPAELYITAQAACPAILVECGFISNQFDLEHLLDEQYQTAFVSVLLSSYLQFIFPKTPTYT